MKKLYTTLVLAILVNFAQAQYGKILASLQFENLENTVVANYGTLEKPVESGAFISIADQKDKAEKMRKLYNSYRWPNGKKVDFSKRFSTKGGSNGIVDCYTLVNPETNDTVRLYVDPYKTSAKYYVPKGLVALTPAIIKAEIEPILEQIQEINNADDGAALKLHAGEILRYISLNFDRNLLIDTDRLKLLVTDTEADKSLIGFLLRSYMFNKFYAMAKDMDGEADYAFEKMKSDYIKYIKVHPDAPQGKLNDYFK